ncbi:MAG TPA: hypothetical protein VGN42_13870, partial [Pirellulales bacterium]|nr:hypothetical protein [Pirellulales bacterium]
VLGRLSTGGFICDLDFRSFPRGLSEAFVQGEITAYVSQPIQFCPWCGVEVSQFYSQWQLPLVESMRLD